MKKSNVRLFFCFLALVALGCTSFVKGEKEIIGDWKTIGYRVTGQDGRDIALPTDKEMALSTKYTFHKKKNFEMSSELYGDIKGIYSISGDSLFLYYTAWYLKREQKYKIVEIDFDGIVLEYTVENIGARLWTLEKDVE